MKLKKLISLCLSAVIIAGSANFRVRAGETVDLDINGDGKVNVFDYIIEKRKNSGDTHVRTLLRNFLLNKKTTVPDSEMFDESAVLEPKGTIHKGEGTFYGGGYVGGCAMLDPLYEEDGWVCAMNIFDYNNAQLAGAYIELTGELGSIKMLVSDLLPEGKKGDVDLCEKAFPHIAPVEKGRVDITWKIIPLDTAENAPISFKFKEGSSPFWCSVQVRNHRYPITKLEYLNDAGEFVELQRRHYNFFESDKMGPGPYTFRITDIYGDVIIDKDIPLVEDDITPGTVQFPL